MTSPHADDHLDRPLIPTRQLGSTGITVPAVGIGCWAIGGPDDNLGMPMGWSTGDDEARSLAGLETAWQHGARLYDTADVYGHGRSERLLGQLVALVPRREIVLASKVGYFAGTAEHGFEPGHMRRQLEQSLDNLRTDHLDIYAFHHPNFGADDRRLHPALKAMRTFRDEGLIKAIGMRGPHRFALDRLTTPPDQRGDKIARFRALFDIVRPDFLSIRDNLLTPASRSEGVFSFADEHNVGILISKPLGQGLLTGTYRSDVQRAFGTGDHRLRKRWFQPDAIAIINAGLDRVRAIVGPRTEDLIRVALWGCLNRSPNAVVLVGFTTPDQVEMNVGSLGLRPSADEIATARQIMADVQERLDAAGETVLATPTPSTPR
ncbi:aldo/keto reductase [Amycolatopsis sp. H20-H5]|uniref:aldo/keto reductase n=1 Tax=Amycolatopsis sp. H20-H5 TaxID=3046309 RepID=UPI002DBE5416|nr:aldo/keto reductase [Amycolatopsis sp. H20-H5]MEC3974892.1 aldo/keto reductase [Amycolatopsis sp. H20-H5]